MDEKTLKVMKREYIASKLLTPYIVFAISPSAAVPLPLVCELTSEETSSVKIRLSERTIGSLKGEIIQNGRVLGIFQSGKPKPGKDPWWSFAQGSNSAKGISVFFKNAELWNPYRRIPRPQDSNRVLFAGLAANMAAIGGLVPLGNDMENWVKNNYAAGPSWVDLGTYPDKNGNDQFYGFF